MHGVLFSSFADKVLGLQACLQDGPLDAGLLQMVSSWLCRIIHATNTQVFRIRDALSGRQKNDIFLLTTTEPYVSSRSFEEFRIHLIVLVVARWGGNGGRCGLNVCRSYFYGMPSHASSM